MCINEALLHCYGIGPVRLAQLHEADVRSWSDVVACADRLPLGGASQLLEECQSCLNALEARNVAYFVDRLAPQDRWRIISEFLEETSFFDIETTGLEIDSTITAICCWHRGEIHTFVEHENLDDFLTLLDDITLLASFNGSTFDEPRVLDAFHIPKLPCPHLDLRWPCYHQGLKGNLKSITARLGFARPDDLADADGELAIHLWNRWRLNQDHAARDLLLRYCASDVLLLVMLAHHLAEQAIDPPETWWQHLPSPTKTESPVQTKHESTPSVESPFGDGSPAKLRARRRRTV